uniref:Ribonuclease P n=1 Tax=Rhabditophanes sp. KR3021 TaxID=114890 RepID=A0AC35TQE6_9BILA
MNELNCEIKDCRKVVISVEYFDNQMRIQEVAQFKNLVKSILSEFYGETGPEFFIESFENDKGTICCQDKDVRNVWAALSLCGDRLGCKIALHLFKVSLISFKHNLFVFRF